MARQCVTRMNKQRSQNFSYRAPKDSFTPPQKDRPTSQRDQTSLVAKIVGKREQAGKVGSAFLLGPEQTVGMFSTLLRMVKGALTIRVEVD
jgi:hypothetical protein